MAVYVLDVSEYYLDRHTHKEQKLRDAAQRGNIRKVARLIKSGVSVNSSSQVRATYIVIIEYSAVRRLFGARVRVWPHQTMIVIIIYSYNCVL